MTSVQNGTVMGGPPPIVIRPMLKKQGSSFGGYAASVHGLAVMPRDKVDYSVTKGGLKLWAVLFVFVVLVASLHTIFTARDDLPLDVDGDGDYDNVDDDDDSIQRLEKERVERETPSRSQAERAHQPLDSSQLKRSKGTATLDDGGDDDEEGEEEEEEAPIEIDDEDEEEEEIEPQPIPQRKTQMKKRHPEVEDNLLNELRKKHKKMVHPDEAVEEDETADQEVEKEKASDEDEQEEDETPPIVLKVHRLKGRKMVAPVETKPNVTAEEKISTDEGFEPTEKKIVEPIVIRVHRTKGKKIPDRQSVTTSDDENKPVVHEIEPVVDEEIEPVESEKRIKEPIIVRVHRIKGKKKADHKLPLRSAATVDEHGSSVDEDESAVDEEIEPVGSENVVKEPIIVRVHRTKGKKKADQKLPLRSAATFDELDSSVDEDQTAVDEDESSIDKDELPVDEDESPVDEVKPIVIKVIRRKGKQRETVTKNQTIEEQFEFAQTPLSPSVPIVVKVQRRKGKPKEAKISQSRIETYDSLPDEDSSALEAEPKTPRPPIRVVRRKGKATKPPPKPAEVYEKEEEGEEEEEKGPIKIKVTKKKGKKVTPTVTISKRSDSSADKCERNGDCDEEHDEKSDSKSSKLRVTRKKGAGRQGNTEAKKTSKTSVPVIDVESVDEDESEAEYGRKFISSQKLHSSYRKRLITNHSDNKIRNRLDEADRLLDDMKLEEALSAFEHLLTLYPQSPRALYGRAKTLDVMAEKQQTNRLLEMAIKAYEAVMDASDVPNELFRIAGDRLVDRTRFRGWMQKAAIVQRRLIDLFPDDIGLRNQFAVTWLMMGRYEDAKKTLYDVLKLAPNDGFALVHYGYILKTQDDDLEEGVKFLKKGIRTKDMGTQDGRFYFHLGDALQRLGRISEAYRVYDEGAENGLFLSKYQRSLYNVEGLTARPWWTHEQTGYARYLKAIEREWMTIRQEALSLLNQKTVFSSEDEKLTSKGQWKQFTLYQKGRRIDENCQKTPQTCDIMSRYPDAAGCTRGQIKFSLMEGGTSVWPHCGPTNCRLRAHLGLIVPHEPKIRVGNETRSWKLGKFIVFDDSFEHEVWHNGNSLRLVLIIDFWHPDLTKEQKKSLTPI